MGGKKRSKPIEFIGPNGISLGHAVMNGGNPFTGPADFKLDTEVVSTPGGKHLTFPLGASSEDLERQGRARPGKPGCGTAR